MSIIMDRLYSLSHVIPIWVLLPLRRPTVIGNESWQDSSWPGLGSIPSECKGRGKSIINSINNIIIPRVQYPKYIGRPSRPRPPQPCVSLGVRISSHHLRQIAFTPLMSVHPDWHTVCSPLVVQQCLMLY